MYDKIQLGVTEVRKFIEFVKLRYGYDLKDYAMTSLRRRVQKYMFLNNISDFSQVLVKLDEQVNLSILAEKMNQNGCSVLMTNADTSEIRKMYSKWHIYSLERTRFITCAKVKHKVGELIITNYELPREDK